MYFSSIGPVLFFKCGSEQTLKEIWNLDHQLSLRRQILVFPFLASVNLLLAALSESILVCPIVDAPPIHSSLQRFSSKRVWRSSKSLRSAWASWVAQSIKRSVSQSS